MRKRPVLMYRSPNDYTIFESTHAAARATGLQQSNIVRSIKEGWRCGSGENLVVFRYADDPKPPTAEMFGPCYGKYKRRKVIAYTDDGVEVVDGMRNAARKFGLNIHHVYHSAKQGCLADKRISFSYFDD